MKKLLLILLMLVLPFQAAWGAASAYCQHETGKATQHFGHHFHQHHASSDADGVKTKGGSAQADSDCGFCHLTAPSPLPPHVPEWAASLVKTYAESPLILFSSHIPEGPARPDRRLVV